MKEVKPIEIKDLNEKKEIKAEDLKDVTGGANGVPHLYCPYCKFSVTYSVNNDASKRNAETNMRNHIRFSH